MSKIVKNITLSPITLSDVGVTIPASDQYTIPPVDYLLWAESSDTVTNVGSGDLVINDGSVDLNISDGIDLVKGIYPKNRYATTVNPVNLSLTANVESSHTFSSNTISITIRNRSGVDTLIASGSGETATKYITLKAGCVMSNDKLDFGGTTIYFKSTSDSTLEILELYF